MNDPRDADLRNALRALVRAALASGYGGHQQQFDTVESLAGESWDRLDDNEKSAFSAGVGVERSAWITKLRDILGEETAPPTLGAEEFLLSVFYTRSPNHLLRRGQWMADMRRRGKGSVGPRAPGFMAYCSECGREVKANVYGTAPVHQFKWKKCLGSGWQTLSSPPRKDAERGE